MRLGRKTTDRLWLTTVCLVASAIALAAAPALMPESYSWFSNTTSESAAQGLPGAWLARLGFALFGIGVLALAAGRAGSWGRWGVALHAMFGVLMLATAIFSHAPFDKGVPVDRLEDTLHSVAATLMGFAYAGGVAVVAIRRRPRPVRLLDVVGVSASVAIPLAMVWLPAASGLLQRVMFLIAYAWYLVEALRRSATETTYQVGT